MRFLESIFILSAEKKIDNVFHAPVTDEISII